MLRRRLLPLLILLLAFGFRVSELDNVQHEFDRSYPHGLAIETLESIQDGRFRDPAPRFYISTIGLPNPLATVVLYMAVALFERSAFVATVISAFLNVLAVAMVWNLARRLFGRSSAIAAAVLMATSPWSVYIARGGYVQGFLEFGAIASAWLMLPALKLAKPRQLLASFGITTIMMQTYAVAMALAGQTFAVCVSAFTTARKLSRVVLIGFAILALAVAMQTLPHFLFPHESLGVPNPVAALDGNYGQSTSIPNPFGIHLNLGAFDHTLRLVSGRDFENELLLPTAPDSAAQELLGDARASLIDALLLLGVLIAAARFRSDMGSRMLLVWLLLPILIATVLMALFKSLQTSYYFMTITAPAGYILASLPFMALRRIQITKLTAQRWERIALTIVLSSAAVLQTGISAWHLHGHTFKVFSDPLPAILNFSPLRWQMHLGNAWRANCREVNDALPHFWMVSVLETSRLLRDGVSRANANSDVWAVDPRGGNCTLRLRGPAPALAEVIPVQFNENTILPLYRSPVISPDERLLQDRTPLQPAVLREIPGAGIYQQSNAAAPLRVNLLWTLLDLASTAQARPGEWVTVTQVLRIDALPDEPYGSWYFAPFVTLADAEDKPLVTVDNAVALQGSTWRVGDIVISSVVLRIPADAAPGVYQLKLSLFDPNQKKNAVFFAPDADSKPILDLLRPLSVLSP